MKKFTLSVLMLLAAVMGTQAKSWKIGPSSVAGMDFASINAAMDADGVAAGDTLYLDQYYNENAEQTVSKAVVIIGTGYDKSLNDEQVVACLTNNLLLKINKATIKSVRLTNIYIYSEECVIERCYAKYIGVAAALSGINHIYSCYVDGYIQGYSSTPLSSRLDIQNCVIYYNDYNTHNISKLTSSIINNNVIYKSNNYSNTSGNALAEIYNSQITNNMIYAWDHNSSRGIRSEVDDSGSGNAIEHNITAGSASAYYPNNKTGYKDAWWSFFVCKGNYSDYYQLATETGDNPAIGYATDGGDCGCHGGMFGCPSGGRPQYIPYFKKVTVGSRTEEGKLPVTLKIAIQSE